MDYGLLFADDATKDEFLDHFEELATVAASGSGLEGFEGGLRLDNAEDAVALMREGLWASPLSSNASARRMVAGAHSRTADSA